MKITIEFRTDNAAFEDNPDEISEIIDKAATRAKIWATYIRSGDSEYALMDSNGNRVGVVRAVDE